MTAGHDTRGGESLGLGYVVRDPEVIALLERVVRCHGCDRLRVKHPDGQGAACPWCRSNSFTLLEAQARG